MFLLFVQECLSGDKAYFGHGVALDFGAALGFYRQAAELHYAPALNSLATMYREGKGTPKDLPQAIDCYKKAAALSNLDAINKSDPSHIHSDRCARPHFCAELEPHLFVALCVRWRCLLLVAAVCVA